MIDTKEKEIDQTIQNLTKYIKQHLTEELTLDQLAKDSGYSKFHLIRKFRDEMGMTIHKYVQNERLKYAAKQLRYTNKSIVEIAYDAHYQSQTAFTYAFKQIYFYTPMIYRERITKENRYEKRMVA